MDGNKQTFLNFFRKNSQTGHILVKNPIVHREKKKTKNPRPSEITLRFEEYDRHMVESNVETITFTL